MTAAAGARHPDLSGRRRATSVRALRCLTVSVGTTALSALVLAGLVVGAGVPAGTANVVAVLCGIGPSYWFNRRWAWGRGGRGDLRREVVPFWTMSVAGLVASTAAVAAVGTATQGWPAAWRSVVLPTANSATFGVLWVAQFVLLDRVVFARPRPPRPLPVPTTSTSTPEPAAAGTDRSPR